MAGAIWGGGLVEANLSLLTRVADRAPTWRGQAIKGTLTGFYLAFLVTVLVSWLIVSRRWGHPLAFLLGLSSFFFGLLLALLSFALTRPRPTGSGR